MPYRAPPGRRRRERDYLVGYIEEQHRRYEIADLNSERYLYLLHERDDVSWLTIADSCGMAVCCMTRGPGIMPGTIVVEPTDKYHGNDYRHYDGDNNDEDGV